MNTSKEPEKFPVKLFYKKGWGLFYEEKVNPFRFLSGAIERTFDPSQYTFWPDFENSYGFASITVIVKCGDEIIETIEFTVTGDLIRDGLAVNPGSSPMGDAVGVKTVNVEPGIDK